MFNALFYIIILIACLYVQYMYNKTVVCVYSIFYLGVLVSRISTIHAILCIRDNSNTIICELNLLAYCFVGWCSENP